MRLLSALFLFIAPLAAHAAAPRAESRADSLARVADSLARYADSLAREAKNAKAAETPAQPAPSPAPQVNSATPAPAASAETLARAEDPEPKPRDPGYYPRFRSDFVLPLLSSVVPGLGQYFQGQPLEGLAYTGIAVGGLAVAIHGLNEMGVFEEDFEDSTLLRDLSPKDAEVRKVLLGLQAYQGSGFMSAYGAFRASLPLFHDRGGRYLFLKDNPETLTDILGAPFRMDFLQRPTSWIPLGTLTALAGAYVYYYRTERKRADWLFSWDDLAFSAALSYNAGVTEEAAFRGYLFPVAYEYTGDRFWLANSIQSVLFALAHRSEDLPYPVAQLALGYYFGYLTKKNGWTVSEAIFNHFWWDVVVFTASFLTLHEVKADVSISFPF